MNNPANAPRLFSLAVLSVVTLLTLSASARVQAQDIQWQYDIDAAIKQAKAEQKLVLLHFTASWCRPCQAMEKFVFRNLEVVRSVEQNLVPVQIDVDRETAVVTEYGVTAVPYDVVITPGGRIIRKQKSPLDSNGYRRMVAGLSSSVKGVEDNSNAALARQLTNQQNEFNFKPSKISEFQSFKPEAPSHRAPTTSHDSAQLARRNRVKNPFFAEPAPAKPATVATQKASVTKRNSFVAAPADAFQSSQSAARANDPRTIANRFSEAASPAQSVAPATVSLDVSNQFSPAAKVVSSFQPPKLEAPQLQAPKLGAPQLSSDFQVMTGAEVQEEAIQLSKQKNPQVQLPVAESQASTPPTPPSVPELSFQASPGPQLTQLMNQPKEPKQASSGFAANVKPNRIHQDRFFQNPVKPIAADATRRVEPKRMAQQLLQPIKQYPTAATEKVKQVTGRVNEAFASIAKRGNPLTPNFAPAQTKPAVVKPQIPATKLAGLTQRNPAFSANKAGFSVANQQPVIAASGTTNVAQSKTAQSNVAAAKVARPNGRVDQMFAASAAPKPPALVPAPAAVKSKTASRPTPSLHGKCPVSLLQQGKWVDGDAQFGCVHRDRLYVFADADKLRIFQADPDLFSPVLAGYDPVLFHESGRLVEGQAKHGVFMGQAPDQRILLFSDAQTRARFQKEPAAYLNTVRQAMNATGGSSSMIR